MDRLTRYSSFGDPVCHYGVWQLWKPDCPCLPPSFPTRIRLYNSPVYTSVPFPTESWGEGLPVWGTGTGFPKPVSRPGQPRRS